MKFSTPLRYIGRGLLICGTSTIFLGYKISSLPTALPNPTPIEVRMQNLQTRINLNDSKKLGYSSEELKTMQSEIEEISQRADVSFYNEIRSEVKSDRNRLYLAGLALTVVGTGASFLAKKNR